MSSSQAGTNAKHSVFVLEGWQSLRVSGPDRVDWLNGLITCNVKAASTERATWGLALDRHGKIQTLLTVVATEQGELLLALSPGTLSPVQSHLDRMLIMEDAELEAEPSLSWLVLLEQASGDGAELLASLGGFCRNIDWLGQPSLLAAIPSGRLPELLADEKVRVLPEEEWTLLRLQAGLPEFGRDISAKDRPHEAGLERRSVDWNKGCYLGQEVVCMQDMRGKVKRRCGVLQVQAPADVELVGAEVLAVGSEQAAGQITSAAATDHGQLAMGILRLDAGDELQLRTELGSFRATWNAA